MDYGIMPLAGNQTALNQSGNSNQQVMGKDDFLQLLVTQLNNQDPLSPMDGQEFAAQLAQFSSLEQLSQINDNLDLSLQSDLMLSQSIANNMAVGLIGREVLALGNSLNGSEREIYFQLPADAASVTLEIRDSEGNLVRTLEGTELATGVQSIPWDGRNQEGEQLPSAVYNFSVSATAGNGTVISASPLRHFHASGVIYENGNPWLLAGGDRISFADVVQVMEAGSEHSPATPDPLHEWHNLD